VKKLLVKLIVFLLFYSSAEAKVILSDCIFSYQSTGNPIDPYLEQKIEINDAKTILTEIRIRTDAEILKEPSLGKVYIQKYNINYQDDNMINAVGLSESKTMEMTITGGFLNEVFNEVLK